MRYRVRDNRRGPSRYSLMGVGCSCQGELRGYVVRNAVKRGLGLAGLSGPATVPVLVPVSDPRAITAAIKLFQGARPAGRLSGHFAGLGDAAQTQSAISLGASGAKAGSIVPGVGTVIGFVAGAAVGFFLGKKPPPRPSGQEIAECRDILAQYATAASQNPDTPIPLDESQLKKMNWCLQAIYGAADIKNKDPRYFDGNFVDLMAMTKDIVMKIYNTPIGGTVNVAETMQKIRKQTFRSAGISFQNPPFTDLKSFARDVFTGVAIAHCKQTAGKGAGGCEQFYRRPEYQRLFYDMLGYAARTLLPNISEADFREASKVAQQTGTSASAVVQAVESIIKRSVQQNETAELLRPGSSTQPPPVTAPSPVPITVTPPTTAPGSGPLPAAGPNPLTPAGMTPTIAADTKAQIDALLAQGVSQSQAFSQIMSSLQAQGIAPTPAVQQAVATEVKSSAPNYVPYIVGGVGLLGLALFMRKRRA